MYLLRKFGSTSNVFRVKLRHSTTGQGLTGLAYNTSGLIIGTICDNEATTTAYTAAGSTIETVTTLGTFATPTATKCRFKEVDSTNHPGVYEIQLDNGRFSVANAKTLRVSIEGAANLLEKDLIIQLSGVDVASIGYTDQTAGDVVAAVNAISGVKRGVALSNFCFTMTLSRAPVTGLIVTSTIKKDAGAFGATTNSVSEIGNGVYAITLTNTEMTASIVTLRFTATGADDLVIVLPVGS